MFMEDKELTNEQLRNLRLVSEQDAQIERDFEDMQDQYYQYYFESDNSEGVL